jgi:hypothetical protein
MEKKLQPLTGKDNARLRAYKSKQSEATAGWQDIERYTPHARVPIPTKIGVEEAKDYVDNVSRLS